MAAAEQDLKDRRVNKAMAVAALCELFGVVEDRFRRQIRLIYSVWLQGVF